MVIAIDRETGTFAVAPFATLAEPLTRTFTVRSGSACLALGLLLLTSP